MTRRDTRKASRLAPRYWPTWLAIGLLRLIEPLPYSWQLLIGTTLGRIARVLPLAQVRVARRDSELCLPDLTAGASKALLRRHFESLGIGVCEIEIGTRILGTLVPLNVLYRPPKDEVLSDFMAKRIARHAQCAIRSDDHVDFARRARNRCRSAELFPAAITRWQGLPGRHRSGTAGLSRR
ncbi:MAG: hypothetical protein FJ171_09430 [Gammaproteobacteria bacterium]|nr:hypothetical protein [Gammaproteobacteria bacterium]